MGGGLLVVAPHHFAFLRTRGGARDEAHARQRIKRAAAPRARTGEPPLSVRTSIGHRSSTPQCAKHAIASRPRCATRQKSARPQCGSTGRQDTPPPFRENSMHPTCPTLATTTRNQCRREERQRGLALDRRQRIAPGDGLASSGPAACGTRAVSVDVMFELADYFGGSPARLVLTMEADA